MNKSKSKILFICKSKNAYGITNISLSTGLANSAKHIVTLLNKNDYNAKLVNVIDNNEIDKEVTCFKPDIVIIEAIWVVPSKFEVLMKLHPSVIWIVRIHSEVSFIASEGIAIDWCRLYSQHSKVYIGVNSSRMLEDLSIIINKKKLLYLPNYYDLDNLIPNRLNFPSSLKKSEPVQIGCFGALRILKDQLSQGFAAIKFANKIKRKLNYHINASRVEGFNSENILKNLRAIFRDSDHKLIEHDWYSHSDFLNIIKNMHLGLQVSFSETFNIVAADFISQRVPIIVSKEITWLSSIFQTKTNKINDITDKMLKIWNCSNDVTTIAVSNLKTYNKNTLSCWKDSIQALTKCK